MVANIGEVRADVVVVISHSYDLIGCLVKDLALDEQGSVQVVQLAA